MLSRRELVRIAGLSAAGAALGGCNPFGLFRPLPSGAEMAAARERAREHASRDTLIQALERIRAWSERNNPVVAKALLPGLSVAEIDEKTRDLPFRLPEEAYWLYGWRNGTGTAPGAFFLYHQWLSLDVTLSMYRALRDATVMGWHRRWFPLFGFQDENFFLPCAGDSEPALPVMYHFLEETEIPISFTNLTTLARTQAEGLEAGALWVTNRENGYLEMHNGSLSKIHQRLNPGARYPYYVDPRETPPASGIVFGPSRV